MAATFTTGNNTAAIYEGFARINGVNTSDPIPGTWDALAGTDTLDVWEPFVSSRFDVGVTAAGVITITNASGTLNLSNFEQITYHGSSNTVHALKRGGAGADSLIGGSGIDIMTGGAGNDTLSGGLGNDIMLGGAGNDVYIVGGAGDQVCEATTYNAEKKTASATDAGGTDLVKSSVSFTLGKFVENLTLTGTGAVNGTGNTSANILIGNDAINTLNGQSGNDTLAGAGGADILTGGTGADKFKFVKSTDGRDTITDFSAAQGDKLVFVSANFGGLAATTSLNAANFRANTTGLAGDADDRFIFETDTGILRYDSNGSTTGGAVEIARLTGVSSLSASAIAIVSA